MTTIKVMVEKMRKEAQETSYINAKKFLNNFAWAITKYPEDTELQGFNIVEKDLDGNTRGIRIRYTMETTPEDLKEFSFLVSAGSLYVEKFKKKKNELCALLFFYFYYNYIFLIV